MNQWSRKDAEAGFNTMLDAARRTPQVVTDGAETVAVVVGPEEYARLTGKKLVPSKTVVWNGREMTLIDLLLAMPHKEGFEIERRDPKRRDIEF